MKAQTSDIRFAEAKRLLDYGFNSYQYKEFAKENEVIGTVSVEKGIELVVDAIFEKNEGTLLKKGQDKNVVQDIRLDSSVMAPVNRGQKIGEAIYTMDDQELAKVDIIAGKDIKKVSVANMLPYVYKNWFRLLR